MASKATQGGPRTRAGKAVVAVMRKLSGVGETASSLAGRATRVVDRVGKSDTDALLLLEAQHREVDRLMLAATKEKGLMAKRAAFAEAATLLELHATIEERHFYPAVETSETEDLVAESYEEHDEVRKLIAEIETADEEKVFDEKLAALMKSVQHHAKMEEEGQLFPKVAELLDGDQREAIGQEMLGTMVELMGDEAEELEEAEPTRH